MPRLCDWRYFGQFRAAFPLSGNVGRAVFRPDLSLVLEWFEDLSPAQGTDSGMPVRTRIMHSGNGHGSLVPVRICTLYCGVTIYEYRANAMTGNCLLVPAPGPAGRSRALSRTEVGCLRLVNGLREADVPGSVDLDGFEQILDQLTREGLVSVEVTHGMAGAPQEESTKNNGPYTVRGPCNRAAGDRRESLSGQIMFERGGGVLPSVEEDACSGLQTRFDPLTVAAVRAISERWDKPWPEFFEEFRQRANVHGIPVEKLAPALAAQLNWGGKPIPAVKATRSRWRRVRW
jgi:hypothetical protein